MLKLAFVVVAVLALYTVPSRAVLEPGTLIAGGLFRVEGLLRGTNNAYVHRDIDNQATRRSTSLLRFRQTLAIQDSLTPSALDSIFTRQGTAGKGSSGETYVATVAKLPADTDFEVKNKKLSLNVGDKVAIKTPVEDSRDQQDEIMRKECELELAIDNAHVVKCYGIVAVQKGDIKTHYMIMNLAGEKTLGSYIRTLEAEKKMIPVADVITIVSQILEATKAINDHKIQHYDLKPDNIMITPAKGDQPLKIVVIDLGNARAEPGSKLEKLCVNNDGINATPLYRDSIGELSHTDFTSGKAAYYNSFDMAAVGLIMADLLCGVDTAMFTMVKGPKTNKDMDLHHESMTWMYGFTKTVKEKGAKDAFCNWFNIRQCTFFRARICHDQQSENRAPVPVAVDKIKGHEKLNTDTVGQYLYHQMTKAIGPVEHRFKTVEDFKTAIDNTYVSAETLKAPECACTANSTDHPRIASSYTKSQPVSSKPQPVSQQADKAPSDSALAKEVNENLERILDLLHKHAAQTPAAHNSPSTPELEVTPLLKSALQKQKDIIEFITTKLK